MLIQNRMSTAVDISVLGAIVRKTRGCIGPYPDQDKGGLQNDLLVIGKNKAFVGHAGGFTDTPKKTWIMLWAGPCPYPRKDLQISKNNAYRYSRFD